MWNESKNLLRGIHVSVKIAKTLALASSALLAFAACANGGANDDQDRSDSGQSMSQEQTGDQDRDDRDERDGEGERDGDDQSGAKVESQQGATGGAALEATAEGAAAAAEAALAALSGQADNGVVIGEDYDFERGSWDVDVLGGETVYEVIVTADGARVGEQDAAEREDMDAANASVSVADAIDAALAQVQGDLDSVSFDDGVWDVSINKDRMENEVRIDPASGNVMNTQQEREED